MLQYSSLEKSVVGDGVWGVYGSSDGDVVREFCVLNGRRYKVVEHKESHLREVDLVGTNLHTCYVRCRNEFCPKWHWNFYGEPKDKDMQLHFDVMQIYEMDWLVENNYLRESDAFVEMRLRESLLPFSRCLNRSQLLIFGENHYVENGVLRHVERDIWGNRIRHDYWREFDACLFTELPKGEFFHRFRFSRLYEQVTPYLEYDKENEEYYEVFWNGVTDVNDEGFVNYNAPYFRALRDFEEDACMEQLAEEKLGKLSGKSNV